MEQESQDLQHIKLLSIFHYVLAAMIFFMGCFPFIHFFMGLALAADWFPNTDAAADTVGIVLMAVAATLILAAWTLAIFVLFAGRCLSKRIHYTYCLVMAAIVCLFMPFGTVLGVFTIIVLMRPSVKPLFS
jgi:hypothetical protein